MVIQKRSPAAACIGMHRRREHHLDALNAPHRDAREFGDALLAVTDHARRATR
jgi:hypothetical protein